MSLIPEPYPEGMLVLSRSVGELFIVDESIVFTLTSLSTLSATLSRKTPDALGTTEVVIHVDGLLDIGPGLRAVLFPCRPGRARIGLVASRERRIRRLQASDRPSSLGIGDEPVGGGETDGPSQTSSQPSPG